MKYFAIIIGLILVIPVFGQRKKKDEEVVTPAYIEGIAYALPRTGVRIYVKAVKESFEPGPYVSYAGQLLGINDAKTRATVKWNIEDIKITTFSEPDPGQVYKAMGDASYLISLTPEGCLAGINSSVSITKPKSIHTNSFIEKTRENDGFSFSNFTDTPFYTAGDSTNGFQPVRTGVEQKAAEAAKRILDCRMNQYDMAAGLFDEFHPDGIAYKVSMEELKSIEKNYLQLFIGRTTFSNENYSFDYIPTSTTRKGEVVFRFSDEKGVVPASDLSGKPVMIEIETEKELTNKYSGLVSSANPTAGESGVYYRMPGVANIKIIQELKTVATARTVIAQKGTVAPVPEELLYGEYAVKFHPETGAIMSVSKK